MMPNPNADSNTAHVFMALPEISNAGAFESMRLAAAAETATDPEARTATMSALVEAAQTKDGESLADALLERALAQDRTQSAAEALQAAKARVRQALGATVLNDPKMLRFVVNTETGAVENILAHQTVPLDERATERSQRNASRVPYGPASNVTNIGGRSGDGIRPRGHK